jgi:DUF2905 family protein
MPTEATSILGRMILLLGILLVVAGLILVYGARLPGFPGRLPGDISIRRGGFHFYFPLGTCILLSLLLTFLLSLISWLRR